MKDKETTTMCSANCANKTCIHNPCSKEKFALDKKAIKASEVSFGDFSMVCHEYRRNA